MDKFRINPLAEDLDHILDHTRELWEEFRGQRIFITGGTGFFGCWLLESFAWINDKLNLDAEALVLTRNYEGFQKKAPHLAGHPSIKFLVGDIRTFKFPKAQFPYLIHGAVYNSIPGGKENPLAMVDEMLQGIKRVLDFCVQKKMKKMLLISTGAVYGPIPDSLLRIPEDFSGSFEPTVIATVYHHLRRMMESLCSLYAKTFGFELKIARCFSFIGPYLPLNGRFAVSDFIKEALLKRPLTIKGDGETIRSYLYTSDLTFWLWKILFQGKSCWPYNVGSEMPTTILELAKEIASNSKPPLAFQILKDRMLGVAQDKYVPNTDRVRNDLNLYQIISFTVAVKKTMHWYKKYYSAKEF